MLLPLVEILTDHYQGPRLDNVLILGVQHVLETTHAMFKSLYKLGLKPENISILGKCYSSCREVYEEMIADGIDVDPNSFSYSSHLPFDEHFQLLVQEFIRSRAAKITGKNIEKIIVLDDGGKCIEIIQKDIEYFPPLVAVEQTSSGYESLRSMTLEFPVVNVARTATKLRLESPMIAAAATERLLKSLQEFNHPVKKSLIIGGGAIGLAMREKLKQYEIDSEIYDIGNVEQKDKKLCEILKEYNLIIGCTGKTSIPEQYHSCLAPQTALVSVSSSDREFDAVHLRRKIPQVNNCHLDLLVDDLLLIRNGFPVNFDGERENIEPKLIQLTIALMAAGILQGIEQDLIVSPGIIPLNPQFIEIIEDGFSYLSGR
jgi:S-adenosylhomocysteine hydrolase